MFVPGLFCIEWALETWQVVQRGKCGLQKGSFNFAHKAVFQMLLSFEKCPVLKFFYNKASYQVKSLRELGHAYSVKCSEVENVLSC